MTKKKLHYWIHKDEAKLMYEFAKEHEKFQGTFEEWLQNYKEFWEEQEREFYLIENQKVI